MAETRRQAVARILSEGPITVMDLARKLHAPVKAVLVDLEHVVRGLRGEGRLARKEAECLSCGFLFRDRKRLETPSRCPGCRRENIQDPEFWIEDASG